MTPRLTVTIPYYGKMDIADPKGRVTRHKIIQEPRKRTPFYVVLNEVNGEILVLPADEVAVLSTDKIPVTTT